MSLVIDIAGLTFGELTAIEREPPGRRQRRWICVCSCGARTMVLSRDLRSGHSTTCGAGVHRLRAHAVKRLPEYGIWQGIKNRCRNPRVQSHKNYGARGIDIDPRWESFACFLADMGRRPSPSHSVERDDVDAGYGPDNCRWATPIEQANNRRNTRWVTYRGQKMALADAVRAAGSVIHIEAAWVRIQHGWPTGRALETPRLHRSPAAKYGVTDPRAKTGLAGPQQARRAA